LSCTPCGWKPKPAQNAYDFALAPLALVTLRLAHTYTMLCDAAESYNRDVIDGFDITVVSRVHGAATKLQPVVIVHAFV
jgi:hypothetical protein